MPTILKKRLFNQRGITLIELIAVILIIGIIAAVGIPVVFNQIQGAQAKVDDNNKAIFADAIERYATLNNGYPSATAADQTVKDFISSVLNATTANGSPFLRTDFPEYKETDKTEKWLLANSAGGALTSGDLKVHGIR